jgi:N-acyl homoserine lactone hydrolase
MMSDQWTIAPLWLATGGVDRSMTLLYKDQGIKAQGPVLGWLLKSENAKVVVDTGVVGPARTTDPCFAQAPEQTLEAQLARCETTKDEIAMVINTHLHIDHCAGNACFGNVPCLVQEREMEYARNPLPVHKPAYDVQLTGINFRFLEGDREIAPGLRVILTPGHSPGSQAVLVNTTQGLFVIAGDTVPSFENMKVPDDEPFWPGGLYVDLREYYHSLNRLKALGGFILPGHDMMVLDRMQYP